MKTLSLLLIAVMIFASAPVFACGGGGCGGDKDKDDAALTNNAQNLCGGGCSKPKPEPKPEPELLCGGGKDKKPAPEPDAMCGGGGCGKGKDKTES